MRSPFCLLLPPVFVGCRKHGTPGPPSVTLQPHLKSRLGMQDHSVTTKFNVQQGLLKEGQGHRVLVHLGKRGRREGPCWARQVNCAGLTFPGPWLTTTVLPCSSLTATVPNSTVTSWVQATPLRPRSSLVTWTLWGGRAWVPEVRGARFRRQGVGRRVHT